MKISKFKKNVREFFTETIKNNNYEKFPSLKGNVYRFYVKENKLKKSISELSVEYVKIHINGDELWILDDDTFEELRNKLLKVKKTTKK